MEPSSCDTFVVLQPLTAHGGVIFGKNSDRPSAEVQELIYVGGEEHPAGSKLKCTFIEIDQAAKTYPVILSKPAWMWGAEMGANSHGVCIGNEAVWTQLNSENDSEEKLLGMDLVRLGLERAENADEALTVITQLLEKYGQGGPCSDSDVGLTYHNSFIIADQNEAWVLETAGNLWAAEKIKDGFRNISNALSIETDIDRMSTTLKEEAKSRGFWNGEGTFNFKQSFGVGGTPFREKQGKQLLKKLCKPMKFKVVDMIRVLRDEDSGICIGGSGSFVSTGSQVSVLAAPGSGKPSCHWFTATPDPSISVYKPFVFTPDVQVSHLTTSPVPDPDPAKVTPRFQTTVDRAHSLWKYHKEATSAGNPNRDELIKKLRNMEEGCIAEVQAFLDKFEPGQPLSEMDELLKDIVETEIKFYK